MYVRNAIYREEVKRLMNSIANESLYTKIQSVKTYLIPKAHKSYLTVLAFWAFLCPVAVHSFILDKKCHSTVAFNSTTRFWFDLDAAHANTQISIFHLFLPLVRLCQMKISKLLWWIGVVRLWFPFHLYISLVFQTKLSVVGHPLYVFSAIFCYCLAIPWSISDSVSNVVMILCC